MDGSTAFEVRDSYISSNLMTFRF